jgi:Cu-Zn family superoxide dismutase
MRHGPAGSHGVHLHETGKCEGPSFESAGAHFNPTGRKHGVLSLEGPHAGDLPNVTLEGGGTGRMETTTNRVTLAAGAASLFDADGTAIVVHAGADDFTTDPAGGSGPRIACGVIGLEEGQERGFSDPGRGY